MIFTTPCSVNVFLRFIALVQFLMKNISGPARRLLQVNWSQQASSLGPRGGSRATIDPSPHLNVLFSCRCCQSWTSTRNPTYRSDLYLLYLSGHRLCVADRSLKGLGYIVTILGWWHGVFVKEICRVRSDRCVESIVTCDKRFSCDHISLAVQCSFRSSDQRGVSGVAMYLLPYHIPPHLSSQSKPTSKSSAS
jgi:hypothetical protein